MEEIYISDEFITLTQFLKMVNIISSGGHAKYYLIENEVYVNNELDTRRGKKLRDGDIVKVENKDYKIIFKK